MKKLLLTGALATLCTVATMAVPAKPVKKTFTLNNGSTIELTLRGDEHFCYYTDAEGNPYMMKKGMPEAVSRDYVSRTWTARKAARTEMVKTAMTRGQGSSKKRIGTSGATIGKHKGLVILMQFQDLEFTYTQADFKRFFNEENYSEYSNSGSVRDYFYKQSYGKLEIEFDVVGPYTAAREMSYYGANGDDGGDKNPHILIAEAVDFAAADVNFADYDWDDDGEVDQVFVVYAGYNEAQGADANTIWPHEWSLYGANMARTYNDKVIATYGCSSELMGDGKHSTGIIDGIGTACHEFSHCLGLPDMYDTGDSNNFGMGNWDPMCAGNYNNNSHTPAGYTSYERWFAGWLEPTELNTMTQIEGMQPLATTPEAYVLYNEANRNEYFLLENRQAEGFDAGLNGHGLLVLHVDYNAAAWEANTVNNNTNRQRMTIIPADGTFAYSASSLAGDPYPGTKKNTSLTNYTTPAAVTYNENADGQKLMSKPIDHITESGKLISFVACRPEIAVPVPDAGQEVEGEASFTISWPAVEGALSYEIELTEIGKAADDPDEALIREFDFEGCISKTTGFTDISSKMSDYGLPGWTGSKLFTTPNKLRIGTSTTTGYLRTPTWDVPASTEFTVVVGVDVVNGSTVKGTLTLTYGNNGESGTQEDYSFQVDGKTYLVYNLKVSGKDLFFINIAPSSQMLVNYFAVYDGVWTAEQLGLETAAARAETRASTTYNFTTEETTYTFTGLNTEKRYVYKVRCVGAEGNYSQWSKEQTFEFATTGITTVHTPTTEPAAIYDLYGRSLGTNEGRLRRGIYIIGNKKKVVR